MCRIKGFIRQLSLRFAQKPREASRSRTDSEYATKLLRLKKKQEELKEVVRRTR